MQQTKVNTAGPAFPLPSHTRKWDAATQEYLQDEGMTLRDYFAAKAMHASMTTDTNYSMLAIEHARWAYEMADAMIKARGN